MDKITIDGMTFYAYHGVLAEERSLGQHFQVDVELFADLRQAGQTDNVAHTIDYAACYEIVRNVLEGEPSNLLERVAERIVERLFTEWEMLQEVLVRVHKPNPPISGHYRDVSVEITRRRQA